MVMDKLTELIEQLDGYILGGDTEGILDSLAEIRIFANARKESTGIERQVVDFLDERAQGLEILCYDEEFDNANLSAAELMGYLKGIKLALKHADDPNSARTRSLYEKGFYAGYGILIDPQSDKSNIQHYPEQRLVIVKGRNQRLSNKKNQLWGYLKIELDKHIPQEELEPHYVFITDKKIANEAWDGPTAVGNVTNHMWGLKRDLEPLSTNPQYVRRVKNRGYLICMNPETLLEYNVDFIPEERRIVVNGTSLSLTPNDVKILNVLYARPNLVCKPEYIVSKVWGHNQDVSILNGAISTLRTRTTINDAPSPITGNSRIGYTLNISE